MKKIFSMTIALALTVSLTPEANAADNQAEAFLGKWKIVMEFRGEEIHSLLTIRAKEDKSLTGKWETPRGATELKDVKVKDGTLTFSRTMHRRDQETTVVTTAKIKDGKLAGAMRTPRGDRPFTGLRAKAGESLGRPRGHGGPEGPDGRPPHGPRPEHGEVGDGPRGGGQRGPGPEHGDRGDGPRGAGQRGPEMMMKRFDTNQDGKLQEDEAPERMKDFFGMIDQNGDGELDAEELETMRRMREQRHPRN